MLKSIRLLLLFLLVCLALLATVANAAEQGDIYVLQAVGTVNPVLANYIEQGIKQAESHQATTCIIQLDTPGGLDTSMRDIVQHIVSSRIPVTVYVSPAGARAASAGVFITMAAHVAAMAPNTAIGAAHPVAISSSGEAQELPDEMKEKVVNDAVAYIKSIAGGHERNVDWAEKAVRESISATEQEALELNVIDLVASDLPSLITKLDGWKVTMLNDETLTIHTEGATVTHIEMGTFQQFLFAIANPTIAYILLSLGMTGIFLELSSPGTIIPGVTGGICLLLAIYALGMMPVNYVGVALIVLGFSLFIAEVFTPTFGLLTAGGVASFTAGSLVLFGGGSAVFKVDIRAIIGMVTAIVIIVGLIVWAVIRGHKRKPVTGTEGLVGATAVTRNALDPNGTVFLSGEIWKATLENDSMLESGEEVIVTKVNGLNLTVKKKDIGG